MVVVDHSVLYGLESTYDFDGDGCETGRRPRPSHRHVGAGELHLVVGHSKIKRHPESPRNRCWLGDGGGDAPAPVHGHSSTTVGRLSRERHWDRIRRTCGDNSQALRGWTDVACHVVAAAQQLITNLVAE